MKTTCGLDRYPKHVWFSSRFLLSIKTHACDKFSNFFIGYQTYELLMSLRNNFPNFLDKLCSGDVKVTLRVYHLMWNGIC